MYFIRTYVDRKQQWGLFINSNMYIEVFNCVKYIYMNGMKITRDKPFERLIKLTKGKKRHGDWLTYTKVKNITEHSVEQVEDGIWYVTSSRGDDIYRVSMFREL